MNANIVTELIHTAALLMALSIVYEISYIIPKRWNKLTPLFNGLLIGFIGLAIMTIPFQLSTGIVFDTRSILISVTALTFGTIPATVAAFMTIIYRIAIGGTGMWMGISVIITSVIIGIIWRKSLLNKNVRLRWLNIYLFGITVHIAMLICTLALPWPTSVQVLKEISIPVMLVYPVSTVLLSLLLLHQKERNEALIKGAAAEKRFRLLVESSPDAIFIQTDGKFSFVNRFAILLFGAESAKQLIGTSVLGRIHPDYVEIIKERIALLNQIKNAIPPCEEVFLKMDNTPVFVDVSAVPIKFNNLDGALVFARDITERKKLENSKNEMEAQLYHQQKLESIGTLAGGVAHEINNPLSGIMNYAQLILDEIDENSVQAKYSNEIIHETERISSIVKSLLLFSRQEKQSHSYSSIYDIINQTISLIKTIIKKDQIMLEVFLDENLPDIKCRSQQIQQVIMNLLTNARDALNEKYTDYHENKIIHLSCSQYMSAECRFIRIIVEDHGNGIPEELHNKVFEPFFSTKPKDMGTGLGLSISFGIIKDHHGKISIDTKEGCYTKFIFDLPVDNGWTL